MISNEHKAFFYKYRNHKNIIITKSIQLKQNSNNFENILNILFFGNVIISKQQLSLEETNKGSTFKFRRLRFESSCDLKFSVRHNALPPLFKNTP